ncbi:zinc transporter ZIP6 isoform X1 [Oryzias melastigma]|nr:zinc transporter ZIP6 isoform X1 [Oryzias melastigma]
MNVLSGLRRVIQWFGGYTSCRSGPRPPGGCWLSSASAVKSTDASWKLMRFYLINAETTKKMRAAVTAAVLLFTVGNISASSECGHHFLSSVIDPQKAEQSQRHHLEALFQRYGENGTISLAGLHRLLKSVGLDRIRSVMVQHREVPGHHDHEKHHHHHHDNEKHHHHHHDNDSHEKHNHEGHQQSSKSSEISDIKPTEAGARTLQGHSAREKRHEPQLPAAEQTVAVTTVSLVTEGGASTVTGTRSDVHTHERVHTHKHENDHDNHHDHHDHGNHHDHDHDHNHDQDHNHDHRHRSQEHLHNGSTDSTECLNASSILSYHGMSLEVGVTLGDFSYLCPALLNQMDSGACIWHKDDPRHENQDHQHHKHAHGHHGNHNQSDQSHERTGGDNVKNITIAWTGGFISITIISLLSLLGVVLIPLMNRVFFKFLLSFLVALAVGTLSGDAFLHLIPHSQAGHSHHHQEVGLNTEHPHHLHEEEEEENLDGVWKGLTALGGVYVMFLIEHFLTLGKMYKEKKQKVQKKWDQSDKSDPEKQPALETDLKPSEDVESNGAGTFGEHSSGLHSVSGVSEEEQVMLAPQVSVVSPQSYTRSGGAAAAYTAEDCENKCHSHFHDTVGQADSMHHHHHDYHHILHHHHSQNHHPHSHSHSYSEQHFQKAGVATLAWMVIMGDGLHNFSDGLAIGAAFTEGLSSGLSTSVAVFCHELPHELGDFAVLLKAGMTVRQAILYNMLSAMMAYLGMVTGIVIGHYAENICMWIFALTAGLFMYVALVDMVPEMLHNDASDHGFSHWGFFLLQNAGILLGFCIMLLIAVFEHRIQLDLGD